MSLINEALKKAQHQRTGPADAPPMPGGGSSPRPHSGGMPPGLLVLLIAGAVTVVVISVVATVYFVNRTPAAVTPVVIPPIAVAPKPAPAASAASPVVIAPIVIKAPLPGVETPPVVAAAPEPAPSGPSGAATSPAEVPPSGANEAVTEGPLADRIADYVDKLHVTGIRTSESGGKVLMNDKVYRVNDVVNRPLGLRLVKIDSDSLTFADANNATYVKNF